MNDESFDTYAHKGFFTLEEMKIINGDIMRHSINYKKKNQEEIVFDFESLVYKNSDLISLLNNNLVEKKN